MSSIDTSALFQPLAIKNLQLKNRLVMAPMTRTFSPNGVPVEANAAYYRRRAEGQVGLILSEGTVVNRPASRNDPNIPFFHGEAALAGWKGVIDAVHAAGGRMGPQLWHTGSARYTEWEPDSPVESPSGLDAPDKPRGEAMTEKRSRTPWRRSLRLRQMPSAWASIPWKFMVHTAISSTSSSGPAPTGAPIGMAASHSRSVHGSPARSWPPSARRWVLTFRSSCASANGSSRT
ncbi:hypothetical protein J2739_002782 [Variovorax soli]|uniref:NADH:flavin oxidoreductase/NADH oxidase N-terminal domain-containing protein n=1 Tax=Variovorax soli TaxID=376815 RepID=A0ABU1NEW4_9BURK|nr:hypothetical protein [Variovorax soli]